MKKKELRVVVAGLVHDHAWSMLPQFARIPGVRLVGGADPNAPLRAKLRKDFGVQAVFADYRQLFRDVDADAVMVTSSNAAGVPIVQAAAAAGLQIMVEKPMAATGAGARKMSDAAKRHRVRLMVNWPLQWNPAFSTAFGLVEAGKIGKVFHARIHMAHQGPREAGCTRYFWSWLYDAKQNGAGALVDYCCYGAAVMGALWGRPRQVTAVARRLAKTDIKVDDNALLIGVWKDHTALAQASWTQNPDFHESLFLGLDGTLETSHGEVHHTRTKPEDFSHWGAERMNKKIIPLKKPKPGYRNGPEHFVHALRSGEPFVKLCRAETGLIAQEILDAGLRSEQTGRRITL
jgi:predicted dehydrogenase